MNEIAEQKTAQAPFPPMRHKHYVGERCLACVRDSAVDAVKAYDEGVAVGAETLATARRVSLMYQRRGKDLAAVLLDARGLVRGMDSALDARIDAALTDAGFSPQKDGAR